MSFLIKRILYFLFIFTFSLTINSQNQTSLPDSLLQKSYKELSDLFYNNKSDTLKAITYAKAHFLKSLKENDTMKMVDGKYYLADIKNNDSIYLNFCDSLINITQKKPNKNYPASIYIDKSNFYLHHEEYSEVLKEITKANKQLKKNKNDSLQNLIYINLGLVKETVGKKREAIKYYKKAYSYAFKKNNLKLSDPFIAIPTNIAISYSVLGQIDSAFKYNNIAINTYKKNNDSILLGYSYFSLGLILKKKKDYMNSINTYLKSINAINNDENYRILTSLYSKIADMYDSLNDKKNTLKFHLKADSISTLKQTKNISLKRSYKYLYDYYKQKNDYQNQLKYINKLLTLKEFILKEKNKIDEIFSKEYDIPNLLAEKKKIITKLKFEAKNSKRNKLIYITLLFISLILIVYQINKKRVYKKRFLALINQKEKGSLKVVKEVKPSNTELSLPDTVIKDILNKLILFEKNNDFLNNDINLQNLATKFNTNSNYLSKVINQHKNLTFTNYINNLRIEYTIQKLKTDSFLRKYTIKAIATEVGFKNSQSFSKAFFKYTGIKPSYFIKELNK
ncbi:helix-turn-helix domain-containing protein [uncultured Tenacibaculum sp.]|uniref:helix-turn-helix domain-containing protein n=1 Tax=uncultured Tenacibaculum sp. TaxID=174713 RepID=UPI00263410B7|nr:helix-turn-helix domain-containing protein [uncultured Tenacibaculum sp.]